VWLVEPPKPAVTMVKQKTDLEKLNIKGSVASVTETRGDYKAVYNFNQDGMLTNISINSKDGYGKPVSGTLKFTYNEQGQLEKREFNFPVGLSFTLYELPFNKEYAFNEGSVGSETFKYDATGRLIERNETSKWNGTTNTYKEVYIYNAKGQLVTNKTTFTRGEVSDVDYEYDAAGNLTEILMDDYTWGEYTYNSKNQLISKKPDDEGGSAKVEYNENGDCIKQSGLDMDGENYTYSYSYTYDQQKNWTKKVEVRNYYVSGKRTSTTTRTIVYNQ
jgi:YD repeat-containing protein